MFAIEQRGLIFDAAQQPLERRIAYFTSLCPLQNGAMLCSFQNGPAKHAPLSTIGLCRSNDGGETWTLLPVEFETRIDGTSGSFGAAELVEVAPGRLLMIATWFDRSDPLRPLFDPVTEGILKSKKMLSISTDGLTWSPWRELPTGDLKGCALTGPIVRWNDGTIAFAFESFKEYDDPSPARHAAWLLVSRDGGESFSPPLLVAQDPEHKVYYWDQRLCAGQSPGEFTAMCWTHDLAQRRDLDVHICHGALGTNGMCMGPIIATTIPGQIAAPLRLNDGRLLAFVVDRGQPGTMALWCSRDNGRTWPANSRLVVYTHDERAAITQGRENIEFKQYWEDMGKWSFGHPALRELSSGQLLLAWYAGTPDCMSLHWARVRYDGETSR